MFGQKEPDLIVRSTPWTQKAGANDTWWKTIVESGLTEPRWVRAVEVRPGTVKGRKITHHANTDLLQFDPDAPDPQMTPGRFTEWAVGKQPELMRPNSGMLMLPGAKIAWDIHYSNGGEDITDFIELGIYFYPKGQEPKYRQHLVRMGRTGVGAIDIPPNTVQPTEFHFPLRQAARIESFQPHMHLRGKAMTLEAILPTGQTVVLSHVGDFNFNWHNSYVYADQRGAAPAAGHDHQGPLVARQHRCPQIEPGSQRLGGLRRPHRRRDGARVGERHLHERRGLSPRGRSAPRAAVEDDSSRATLSGSLHRRDMSALRVRAAIAAAVLSVCVAAQRAAQQPTRPPLPLEPLGSSGEAIFPAFEGWGPHKDGSIVLLLGYYNRNKVERVDIPIGPNNRIEPGGPDFGQPTQFEPSRQHGVFAIRVPKDFGNKKLTWTITVNGQTSPSVASGRTRRTGSISSRTPPAATSRR